jgi:hypothetical protein
VILGLQGLSQPLIGRNALPAGGRCGCDRRPRGVHGARTGTDHDHGRAAGVQQAGLGQGVQGVVAVQLVGPAGARDHADRRGGVPAGLAQAPRQGAQLLAGHVEDFGVGAAAGVQVAGAGHRGGEADAAPAAAPRERPQRVGGRGQRGGHAGHHLDFQARLGAGLQFFLEAAEDARVAALEAHDQPVFAPMAHDQRVDRGLPGAVAEAALADVDPLRARREFAQCRVGERVVQHHVGPGQQAGAAQRDQVRRAGAGSDECDLAHACQAFLPQAAALTSSAPLVRLLAGSTMISAPPTRLSS